MSVEYSSSPQYHDTRSLLIAPPFALCCWARANNATSDSNIWRTALAYVETGNAEGELNFEFEGDGSACRARLWRYNNQWAYAEAQNLAIQSGVWYHLVGNIYADGTYEIWVNGAQYTDSNTGYVGPTQEGRFRIGSESASGGVMDGQIAHAAFWRGVTLSRLDARRLYAGASPLHVKRGNLAAYWRLPGGEQLPKDDVGTLNIASVYGTPSKSSVSGPPVFQYATDPLNGLAGMALFFGSIDEASPNDADYVYTVTKGSYIEFALSSVNDPGVDTGCIVRFRAKRGQDLGSCKCGLYQNTTLIEEWTEALSATPTTYSKELASANVANITNHAQLRLRLTGL